MNKKKYPFCLFDIKHDGARVIREVTNACNYTCSYCIFSSKRWNTQFDVTTQKMKETLDDLRRYGVKYFKVTGGEPFLRKDLCELLEYASSLGFTIDISTNASIINDEIIARIKNLRIDYMHVSLDGHNKQIQEAVRGISTFVPTIRWIQKIVASWLPIRVGTLVHADNQHMLEDIIKYVKSLWVPRIIFSYMEAVGKMRGKTDSPLLATVQREDLEKELHFLQTKYTNEIRVDYAFAGNTSHEKSTDTCPGGKEFLFIDHKWQISPCTWISEHLPDYISQTTLHTNKFASIMQQNPMQIYQSTIQTLARYGVKGCPKTFLDEFKAFALINKVVSIDDPELWYKKYDVRGALYMFTTENIHAYYKDIDVSNKDVLTVGWSGDHMLNAWYNGAKNVTCFDKNQLAQHYINLKRHAIQNLDFDVFKEFFDIDSNDPRKYDVYKQIRKNLTVQSQYFWDCLYNKYHNNGKHMKKWPMFRPRQDSEIIKKVNIYLHNEKNYKRLQKIISNKQYKSIHASLENLHSDAKYDILITGNISDYANTIYPLKSYMASYKAMIEQKSTLLSKGWTIQLAYIYEYTTAKQKKYRSHMDNPWMIKKYYAEQKYNIHIFPSIYNPQKQDAIILYTNT